MKQKITILAMLITVLSFAQTTVHNTKVKLKNVNTGVVSDSLLVIAPNDEIRKIPRSVFLQGVSVDLSDYYTQTEISNLLGNYAIGDHTVDTDTQLSESQVDAFTANNGYLTTLPSNINADKIANGSVSNSEFQHLNGLTEDISVSLAQKEETINKVPSFSAPNNTTYPTTKAVNDNFVKLSNTLSGVDDTTSFDMTENSISFVENTLGSTGFPSEYGASLNFNFETGSNSATNSRNFTLYKESQQGKWYLRDFDINGDSNGFKEIYHSGNLNPDSFVKKSGDTMTGDLTATAFKTTNWTFKQVGNNIEIQFNGVTKMRFKSDGTIEATDFKLGL